MRKYPIDRIVLFFIVLASLVAGFHAMIFDRLPAMFMAPEEDLDFAWFIPLVSLSILWKERKEILASLGAPSFAGVLLTIPLLFIGFLGVRGLQVRFELLAFALLPPAAAWAIFGRKTAKTIAFPFFLLLFCMPVASYLSLLTVHLRLIVSACSATIVKLAGTEVARQGNLISLPGVVTPDGAFAIDIANPCSGLRSIFALMALSLCYGYFTLPDWKRRGVLFALSIPLAMLGNIVRIVSICLVARYADTSFAIGFYHDFSGFVVFGVAIALMVCISGMLLRGVKPKQDAAQDGRESDSPPPRASLLPAAAEALLVIAAMSFQLLASEPVLTDAPQIELPALESFTCETIEPSVAETNLLKGAAIEKRRYKHEGGFWIDATCVVSAANKSSLHRPELCLPSQGFQMLPSFSTDSVKGTPWQVIPLTTSGNGADALFAYTFRNQDGFKTSSHLLRIFKDVWDRSFRGRIDRWAMITLLIPSGDKRTLAFVLDEFEEALK